MSKINIVYLLVLGVSNHGEKNSCVNNIQTLL